MGNEIKTTGSNAIKTYLANPAVKKKFEEMLGKKAPGFISSIVSAVTMNTSLSRCEPGSVVAAAAIAASLDLPINPSLGMAHIVSYKNVAQFQMGWKGFIQLGMRSGMYQLMNISDVHEGDIKNRNRFTGVIEFNKDQIANYEKRPIVGYLFYFKLTTGFEKYFYMTKAECEAHGKKYSKSYDTGNWKKDFDGMARKTVVKMGISKYGILSIEMQNAIVNDQAVVNDDGDVVDYPDNAENDISDLSEVVEDKVKYTPKQKYNTNLVIMKARGLESEMNEIIKGHEEVSGRVEKSFTDADFEECIKQMEDEVAKNGK